MKASIIYAYIALMGITTAQDTCVEGKRVTISPGYTVEYKCDKYRNGQRYNSVLSHQDCATKCQVGNLDVCTYHAAKKICIVGDPNSKEGTSIGATYMIRVEEEPEDPFAEDDPFAETCEEERDGCKTQLENLKGELDKCRADHEASSNNPDSKSSLEKPSCGVRQIASNHWYNSLSLSLVNCKKACNADSKCLAYAGTRDGKIGYCYLYYKGTADLYLNDHPYMVTYDKRCG